MKDRKFSVISLKDKDGNIRKCHLDVSKEGQAIQRLHHLSKRDVEYLIWLLADVRKDMTYTEDEPRLFENLDVNQLIVKIDENLILEGYPPPT